MIHLISMKIDIFILVADKSCFLAIEFKNSDVTENAYIFHTSTLFTGSHYDTWRKIVSEVKPILHPYTNSLLNHQFIIDHQFSIHLQ